MRAVRFHGPAKYIAVTGIVLIIIERSVLLLLAVRVALGRGVLVIVARFVRIVSVLIVSVVLISSEIRTSAVLFFLFLVVLAILSLPPPLASVSLVFKFPIVIFYSIVFKKDVIGLIRILTLIIWISSTSGILIWIRGSFSVPFVLVRYEFIGGGV